MLFFAPVFSLSAAYWLKVMKINGNIKMQEKIKLYFLFILYLNCQYKKHINKRRSSESSL